MTRCAMVMMLAAAIGVAAFALAQDAVPKPSVVPVSWELEFEYDTPQSITVKLPGDRQAQTYWYVLFTVTNSTDSDKQFAPRFVLYTDTGEVLKAGQGVSSLLFEQVQKRLNSPLLVGLASVTGRLLQGDDNAKQSVAIWKDFDPKARKFDIFVGGLSGETVKVKLPVAIKQRDAEGKVVTRTEVTLSKTLQLTYFVPGEAAARPQTAPRLVKKQWVMR